MRLWIGLGLLCLLGAGCAAEPGPPETVPFLALGDAASSIDGVSLTWFVLEATLRSPDDDFLEPRPVSQFRIERRNVDSGGWTLVADNLPASARNYVDRGLDPGLKIRYRLTARLEGGGVASAETPNPVDGPPPWAFEFRSAIRPAGADKGMVFIRIQKFEKGIGKVEASHIHFERDEIGWWEEKEADGPVSRHRVRLPGGKSVEVDFHTGARLIAVEPKTQVVELRRCKPIFDMTSGKAVDCNQVLEQRSFPHHQISWSSDKDGMHQVNVPKEPIAVQPCERHRAKPEEVPKEPRVLEARQLLEQADRLWDSDSDVSIRIYQRLLKDYKDIVIRLQVRNKVEGRARQADDH